MFAARAGVAVRRAEESGPHGINTAAFPGDGQSKLRGWPFHTGAMKRTDQS
jgi:hypothetical protein